MKKLLICISMLLCLSTFAYASNGVPLIHHPIGSTHGGYPKTPAAPWYIAQDGNVLTMSATPCDYTLSLYDEDDELAYSVFVPAGTTMIVLPTASTDCSISLISGDIPKVKGSTCYLDVHYNLSVQYYGIFEVNEWITGAYSGAEATVTSVITN